MIRTDELDKHWFGYFWCVTCRFYTGRKEFHCGHVLEYLGFKCPLDLVACKQLLKG